LGHGYRKLEEHLHAGAREGGYILLSNGREKGDPESRVFVCRCYRRYQGKQSPLHDTVGDSPLDDRKHLTQNYRGFSWINDRGKNSRGKEGLNLPRKRVSSRALSQSEKCRFRITIKKDAQSFFLSSRGCTNHSNHYRVEPQLLPLAHRKIAPGDLHHAGDVAKSGGNDGVTQNAFFQRTGHVLPYEHCRRIREAAMARCNGSGVTVPPIGGYSNNLDELINYLVSDSYKVCILTDRTPGQDAPGLRGTRSGVTSMMHTTYCANHRPPSEGATGITGKFLEEALEFAASARVTQGVPVKQRVCCAVAFAKHNEIRRGRLYPEVMFVDSTENTNNEDRPLLCIGMRDSSGKVFVSVYVYMPCLTRWAYRWVFGRVLPEFLGSEYMEGVRALITDGDPQQNTELDIAFGEMFPSVHRIRCGWHIVDRTWDRLGPRPGNCPNVTPAQFDRVKDVIHGWMYSWMYPGFCETEEEYIVSKSLFLDYCHSLDDLLGTSNVNKIVKMLHNNIEIEEERYCYWKRKHLRHFDACMNTPLEGCNRGMKSCAAAVKPTHTLPNSAKKLSIQTNKRTQVSKQVAAQVLDQKYLFMELNVAQQLTFPAASILAAEWEASNKYITERQNNGNWRVVRQNYGKGGEGGEVNPVVHDGCLDDGCLDDGCLDALHDQVRREYTQSPSAKSGSFPRHNASPAQCPTVHTPNKGDDSERVNPAPVSPDEGEPPAPRGLVGSTQGGGSKARAPSITRAKSVLKSSAGRKGIGKKRKNQRGNSRRTSDQKQFRGRLIPSFSRVREVTTHRDGGGIFLRCSCLHSERIGIPCRHIFRVLRQIRPACKEPAIGDIDIRWRKLFDHFCLNRQAPEISEMLEAMRRTQSLGVAVTEEECRVAVPLTESGASLRFIHLPTAERLRHYRPNQVHSSLKRNNLEVGSVGVPMRLSQDIFCSPDGRGWGKILFPGPADTYPEDMKQKGWSFYGPHLAFGKEATSLFDSLGQDHHLTVEALAAMKDLTFRAKLHTAELTQRKRKEAGSGSGIIVSACCPTSKKRKTHGNKRS
jgi:hypothetical protein